MKLVHDFLESNNICEYRGIEGFNDYFVIENIDTVVEKLSHKNISYNLHTYFTKNISYTLDAAKKEGMEQFLSLL